MLSELGKGTTARIYLPVADPEPETAAAQVVVAPADTTGAETILLVEDEARVRKLIAGILASRGYRVLEAARGEEAIRLARTHQGSLHLALVDVVMPEMSGPDLIRQIEPLCPGLRVLFISGHTEEAMVNHGFSESAAFLQKPFLPDALAGKVREVLDAASRPAKD
jgi:DNA-binding response OmpR family regulator